MRILVTGSSGHLGEGIARRLAERGDDVVGLDIRDGAFTNARGSICDRRFLEARFDGIEAVIHTATLHKPHVATHSRSDFVETNVQGTLNLLEESRSAGVGCFVFTSTTSAFGRAMVPAGNTPAAWIDEHVIPEPKNIYGVTKLAAENLCELAYRADGLPCLILRTSRFFPDVDDRREVRDGYADENVKANEYLYRRVDLGDAVDAHLLAVERACEVGFDRYVISATTPFAREDLAALRRDAEGVVERHFPDYVAEYGRRGWSMFPTIDRVYDNEKARLALGWEPRVDFGFVLEKLCRGESFWSPLALAVGEKGYHDETFSDGPYPVHE